MINPNSGVFFPISRMSRADCSRIRRISADESRIGRMVLGQDRVLRVGKCRMVYRPDLVNKIFTLAPI